MCVCVNWYGTGLTPQESEASSASGPFALKVSLANSECFAGLVLTFKC